jgi:hypothetical protein
VAAVLLLAAIPVRLLIPKITGFLAVAIPIAISIANLTGLNPLVCSLLVMIVGDSVLFIQPRVVHRWLFMNEAI